MGRVSGKQGGDDIQEGDEDCGCGPSSVKGELVGE